MSEVLSPTKAHSAGVGVEDANGGPDQVGAGFHQLGVGLVAAHDASDRPDPVDGQVFQDGVAGVVADDDDRPAGGGGQIRGL
jgi:hypothetical protein